MKKTLLILALVASFVVVPTSLLSCSNPSGGGTSDKAPAGGGVDNTSNPEQNSGGLKNVGELEALFPKFGTLKEKGTISARMYEFEGLIPAVTEKLNGKENDCMNQYGDYQTSDGDVINIDYKNFSYVEITDIDEKRKNIGLRIIEKGTTPTKDNGHYGKEIQLSWKDLATLTGTEVPNTIDELFKCVEKMGKFKRSGKLPYCMLSFGAFNEKVTNYLKDKELNCCTWNNGYRTEEGKKVDSDYSKVSLAEVTGIDVKNKKVNIRFVEKGTTPTKDKEYYGKEVWMTWAEVVELTK